MMKIAVLGFAALFLYYLEQYLYRKLWNHNLSVTVDFIETCLFEGEQGHLKEVIENGKKLPLPILKVKFQTSRNLLFSDEKGSKVTDQYYRNDIFQIGAGERITRTLTFTGKKRGYYKIYGIDLVGADLFLITMLVGSVETSRYLYVYPRPFYSEEFHMSLQQLNGEMLAKHRLLEDPFEYRGIREYQPYDDMRSINWKATARTEELKVNQKNYTSVRTIRIFFNTEDSGILKKEDSIEAAFQVVAGIAEFFLRQGVRVACYGNGRDIVDKEPLMIEPGAGSGQMDRIYRALARVDVSQPVADFVTHFRQKILLEGMGTMTFFVSAGSYRDFIGLLREYSAAKEDYIWFYPTEEKKEPEVPKDIRQHICPIYFKDGWKPL